MSLFFYTTMPFGDITLYEVTILLYIHEANH